MALPRHNSLKNKTIKTSLEDLSYRQSVLIITDWLSFLFLYSASCGWSIKGQRIVFFRLRDTSYTSDCDLIMTSFDVSSLFIDVPLHECVELFVDLLYEDCST